LKLYSSYSYFYAAAAIEVTLQVLMPKDVIAAASKSNGREYVPP